MSEIEKMMQNAGIAPKRCSEYDNNMDCGFGKDCYPPFTAEKQIALIKFLAKRNYGDYTSSLLINITDDRVYFSAAAKPKNYVIEVLYDSNRCTDFENALANLINDLWQDLTSEEKQQVKGILK